MSHYGLTSLQVKWIIFSPLPSAAVILKPRTVNRQIDLFWCVSLGSLVTSKQSPVSDMILEYGFPLCGLASEWLKMNTMLMPTFLPNLSRIHFGFAQTH